MGLNVAAPHIIRFITVLETKSRAVTASSAADGFDDSLLQAGFQLPRPEHGATPQRTRLTAPTLTGIPGPSPLLGPPLSLRSSSSLPRPPGQLDSGALGWQHCLAPPSPQELPSSPIWKNPKNLAPQAPRSPRGGKEGGAARQVAAQGCLPCCNHPPAGASSFSHS